MKRSLTLLPAAGLLLALGGVRTAVAAERALFKIDPSARSAALGSALTAAAGDPWSLFANPAGLSSAVPRQVLLSHALWLEGDSFQSAGVILPGRTWTAGAGLLRLSHGQIEGRDAQRRPTGGFTAEDQALGLTLSRRWGALGAGATVKQLRERIGSYAAADWAFDGGAVLAPAASPLSWGAALRNLNPRGGGSDASASLGAAFRAPGLGLASLDVVRSMDGKRTEVRAGLERWMMDTLALRAGYAPSLSPTTSAPAWRTGLGFRRGFLQLDYALVPAGDLGTTQRMSLSFQF